MSTYLLDNERPKGSAEPLTARVGAIPRPNAPIRFGSMESILRTTTCTVLAAWAVGAAFPHSAAAQEVAPDDNAIQSRIRALERELQDLKQTVNAPQNNIADEDARFEELDQKIRVLERRQELEKEAAAEKAKQSPTVSLGPSGFSVTSPDSNFVFKVRGYVQADARAYLSDEVDAATHDTFLIRRARPIFEGTVYDRFDYRVMLDLASQSSLSSANNGLLQDAYVAARLWPELQIQAGKFKEPVGLERLQSGANLLFIERAYPTQLLPNRDVGVQLQGDLFSNSLRYEVGIFNGVADGGSGDFDTADDDKDVAARLFATPFRNTDIESLRGLGFGVSGTYGNQEGNLRSFASEGSQRFFTYRTSAVAANPNVLADGNHWRLSPQAYYYWGPFGLLAEYAISSQEVLQAGGGAGAGETDRLTHTGWQVAASYFLTGERNAYRAVNPKRPVTFREGSGLGAFELAARVHSLDVDDDAFPIYADPATAATKALTFGVGLNWHLNRNIKLSFDYSHTDFKAAAGNPFDEESEDVFLSRVQFSF